MIVKFDDLFEKIQIRIVDDEVRIIVSHLFKD